MPKSTRCFRKTRRSPKFDYSEDTLTEATRMVRESLLARNSKQIKSLPAQTRLARIDRLVFVGTRKVEARSPTSLLSLPDDLLHLIFEEVHDERNEEVDTRGPVKIAEILVNKRIFAVARPIWFSRLSIRKDQLDRRLSGLLGHQERRRSLRRLKIAFSSTFALLTESIIAQLPSLTHFSVTCDHKADKQVHDTLVRVIASITTLRCLETSFLEQTSPTSQATLTSERLLSMIPPSVVFWRNSADGTHHYDVRFRGGIIGVHYFNMEAEAYRLLDWNSLEMFESGPCRGSPAADAFLEGLAAALQLDDVSRARPPNKF